MIFITFFFLNILGLLLSQSLAFVPASSAGRSLSKVPFISSSVRESHILLEVSAHKLATEVTGEELERILTEWDQPLLIDAYATWCGPCQLMAPEFEEAAKELDGKVRFVKLDTDKEPDISARLNVMGLPTLLFLDVDKPVEGSEGKAVLKLRFEGALKKDSIVSLCEHHFFGASPPDNLY